MMTIDKKRAHNLQVPISRLPNEVLSKIFFDVKNTFNNHHIELWIGITQVCHAWREVALKMSLLWSHIDVLPQFRNLIPEMLRRSKQSPLTVFCPSTPKTYEHGLLDEVKKHSRRFRSLRCQLRKGDDIVLDQILSQTDLQSLDTLAIVGTGCSSASGVLSILSTLHLRAGSLKRLSLKFCCIDWNTKLLQGLTHLVLANAPGNCRLGSHDFVAVLSNTPALEVLQLSNFLRETDEDDVPNQNNKIGLQYLRELIVTCQVPEMAKFLQRLVPPISKLHLDARDDEIDSISDEFHGILSWVSKHFRMPTLSPIRSFYLRHYNEEFKIEGFCDILSQKQISSVDPVLRFSITWPYDDGDYCDNVRTFLASLPLGNVAFLHVFTNLDVDLDQTFWVVAFGSIPTLESIFLDTGLSGFWEAMSPNGDKTKKLPFSALSSLTVVDQLLDSQLIIDNLHMRSELGVRLQELYFSKNAFEQSAATMKQLGELVSHVLVYDD